MKRIRFISFVILLLAIASVVYTQMKYGKVKDAIPPSISMEENEIKVSVEDGEEVLLAGITANDNKDGDVTETLTIDTISPFNKDGVRYVTVAAFDSNNNVGKATREITYKDYRQSHFDITAPLTFRQSSNIDILENVTANDVIDGDVTGSICFASGAEILTDTPGEYEAALQVKNSAGDLSVLPITVRIQDPSADPKPVVGLKHYVKYVKKNKSFDAKKLIDNASFGYREYKVVDGDEITAKSIGRSLIHFSDDEVNYKKPGVYQAEYKLTLPDGDDDVTGKTPLIVIVED